MVSFSGIMVSSITLNLIMINWFLKQYYKCSSTYFLVVSLQASPLASFTVRNLLLYTTNEHWQVKLILPLIHVDALQIMDTDIIRILTIILFQVVNLKEARDFSNEEKFIYAFKVSINIILP